MNLGKLWKMKEVLAAGLDLVATIQSVVSPEERAELRKDFEEILDVDGVFETIGDLMEFFEDLAAYVSPDELSAVRAKFDRLMGEIAAVFSSALVAPDES